MRRLAFAVLLCGFNQSKDLWHGRPAREYPDWSATVWAAMPAGITRRMRVPIQPLMFARQVRGVYEDVSSKELMHHDALLSACQKNRIKGLFDPGSYNTWLFRSLMNPQNYSIWIEAEEWAAGEWTPHHDNTDVMVHLSRWSAIGRYFFLGSKYSFAR
jgi:hypothetical protein